MRDLRDCAVRIMDEVTHWHVRRRRIRGLREPHLHGCRVDLHLAHDHVILAGIDGLHDVRNRLRALDLRLNARDDKLAALGIIAHSHDGKVLVRRIRQNEAEALAHRHVECCLAILERGERLAAVRVLHGVHAEDFAIHPSRDVELHVVQHITGVVDELNVYLRFPDGIEDVLRACFLVNADRLVRVVLRNHGADIAVGIPT